MNSYSMEVKTRCICYKFLAFMNAESSLHLMLWLRWPSNTELLHCCYRLAMQWRGKTCYISFKLHKPTEWLEIKTIGKRCIVLFNQEQSVLLFNQEPPFVIRSSFQSRTTLCTNIGKQAIGLEEIKQLITTMETKLYLPI